ncbi:DUF342 domain-containing protein [Syntrophomonas erecta]
MTTSNNQENGAVIVSLSPDKLVGYIEITAPVGNGKPCTREQVDKALQGKQVVYGMMEESIARALQPGNWNKKVVVARGQEPVDGKDARLVYKFPLPGERTGPKLDEKGNVDHHNLELIHNVRTGEVLVERIPPTDGIPGINVHGQEVAARKGKDVVLPRGKNTFCDDEGCCLYAGSDGHVNVVDGRVSIEQVLVISQDIDYATGNIDFIGNILINGNVTTGFKVYAGGDLEITGFIEGGEVKASGNIMVKGGITTGPKGYVRAGQNIYARFIENSRVEAGIDIQVGEAIMQSLIKAGGSVKVTDRKAAIVGGRVQASQTIECKILGSQLATQTVVEVGINPHYREEYQQLNRIRTEKKNYLDNLNHNLQTYQRSGISIDELSERKRLALIRILDQFKSIRQEISNMEERIAFLESEFEKIQTGKVRVLQVACPGVRISIGQSMYLVNDPIKYSEFILEGGEIRLAPLR